MVDKSWGVPGSPSLRVRTNATLEDRAADRVKAREERVTERAAAIAQQTEERAARREADVIAREQVRSERRQDELRDAAADPHGAASKRHRASGRKDVVREDRDTKLYKTAVDLRRMRELAARGVSVSGLAGAFGISHQKVEELLAASE